MVDGKVDKVPSTSTLVDPTSSSWARPVLTNARLAVEVFDGTGHFGMWQSEVLDALFQQGLDIAVEESKPEDVEERNWLTINRLACGTIRSCLSREQRYAFSKETSAYKLWVALEEKFLKKNCQNKLFMKKRLFRFTYVPGTTMNDHITSFNQLVTDLMNMDEVFKDQDLALILLGSLPEEYELLETTLLNGKDDVSFSEKKCTDKRRRSKSRQRLSKNECAFCHEKCHWKRDCPRLKTKDNHYKGEAVAEANVTKCDDEELDLSLATSSSINASEIWLSDSACSHHITSHREWFSKFEEHEEANEDGTIETLKGVRYSPKLKTNLIFVGTLESKGFEVRAKDGVMNIISGVLVVMKGIRKINNTYNYKGRKVVGTIAAVTDGDRNSEAVKLWHMRLGHAGEKSLNLLIKQGLLKGLSSCPSKTRFFGGRHYYVTFVDDFSRRVSDYDSLHVCGSAAYYHVKESKLDPRAKKALFMGITSKIKGCHLWCSETKKTIFSRDVTFNESAMLKKVNAKQLDGTLKKVEFKRIIVTADREPDDNSPMVEGDYEEEEVQAEEPRQQQHESIATSKRQLDANGCMQRKKGFSCAKIVCSLQSRIAQLTCGLDLELVQMDVKTAFLHGDLEEKIYMVQPEGSKLLEKQMKFDKQTKQVSSPIASQFKISAAMSLKNDAERAYMEKVPYANDVGSLMYAMICTRPYISHAVGMSTTALSTTEAEYMAMTETVKEEIWLQGLLGELGIKQKCVTMHSDSQSAIHLAKNQVYHARTKHIDVRYHFIREILEESGVRIQKIHTSKNPADMLTKVVAGIKFNYCLDLINVIGTSLLGLVQDQHHFEEFYEKHYEKLLPIMADKYEYEQRKKEKLEGVKARLEFGEARKKTTRA
ncbi:retrovirus-related pol polyprotein from transposon TNT 1-94 [Tanacetum coccineum]